MNQTPTADDLRRELVDAIVTAQPVPAPVEEALRTVHREAHLPGADLADAYKDQAVVIKDNPDGPLALSCASVPSVVAMMLAQLDVQPGDRILEVGAGTGYNAALLAELTGPKGQVTTIDVDDEVALHARTTLNNSGYSHVQVMARDGLIGAPEYAPYDRITATVGVWDVPSPWWDQLVDGGRLVLPLRWRGQTRSVALDRDGDALVCDGMELCGFVPMVGQDGERTTAIGDGTVLLHHDQDQQVDAARLDGVFTGEPAEEWSQTRVGGEESFDGVWLRASAYDDAVCRIEVTKEALEAGVRRPSVPVRTVALVVGSSLAYLIHQRDGEDADKPILLGAAGYGRDGAALARSLVRFADAWGRERDAVPHLSIYPAGTAGEDMPAGHIIDKTDSRLVLRYAPRG
ncbi:methyltransferase, FxLD system [Streptomyces sp. NPDC002795]|uniref:methyltransferase, FxLD system n=1 Tax=Streptomyces sp. NPDC002795 TaxID=3364665 RepID=UPI0036C159F1